MPYKISGNKILHFKGGRWKVKQTCSSHENAVKALGLLQGLEHGTIKPSQVGKGKYATKRMSSKKFRRLTESF